MKKLLYLMLIFLMITGALSGCSKKTITIGGLAKDFTNSEIADGTTGNLITLDKQQAEELYASIKDIEFTRKGSSKTSTGWSYSINFLNSDSVIEKITLISEDTIAYNGYFYKAETPSIDMEYMASLFGTTFQAVVLENKEGLLVAPDSDSNEFRSSDKISVGTKDAKIFDSEQKEISVEELQAGDVITIIYNGVVLESYPAQISADSIIRMEPSILVEGYLALIDDIYQEDSGLNSDISIISLDTLETMNLSGIEKQVLLAKMKDSYGVEIREGTYEELVEEGIIDGKMLYFPDGILISIINPEYNEKDQKIKCGVKKWRGGDGAIGYDATARYDGSVWKITKDNMWIS